MYSYEIIIKPPELQILLNKFEDYEITYPVFPEHVLFKGETQEKDGYILHVNDIDLSHILNCDDHIKKEIPNQNDLLECFLASGCIHYKNNAKFVDECEHYGDPHKKIYFAVDTNILYHRFISRSSVKDAKIVISPTVVEEIQSKLNDKYSRNQIRRLKSVCHRNDHLFNELNNKRMKDSRKAAYFAKLEYKKINTILTDEEDIEIKSYKDYDLKIVKELKKFESQTGSSVILLTADRAIVDYCDFDNLGYFVFDYNYPSNLNAIHISDSQFRGLLFDMAVTFGFIKINKVIIFGEFGGKHESDLLKLKFLNADLFEKFQKDLQICRRLSKLDIDF